MAEPSIETTSSEGLTQHRFIDPRTLMSIKHLELRAKVVVEGFWNGLHRSPYHGFSVEFTEYRQYTPGDDPRYLDWKLYARSDRYYIKKFEDDLKKNNMLEQFYKCFDKIYYSSRMGKRKPEENCFNQVLEENGLIAENTLFIDDSIQHIEGAKKAGIKTFHLEKNKSILDLVPDIIQSKHHQ